MEFVIAKVDPEDLGKMLNHYSFAFVQGLALAVLRRSPATA